MGAHLRKMKSYTPRKRKSKEELIPKETLLDLHRKIGGEARSLILSIEQKEIPQIHWIQNQLKSDVLKHKTEMYQIASGMGDKTVKAVREFLDSIDLLIHTRPEYIDPATVHQCYTSLEQLQKTLEAA